MTVASKMGRMPAKKPVPARGTFSRKVSARLRALRDERGWLVNDVADKLARILPDGMEIATSTLHCWDNGSRKVDPDYYPYLAKVFGVTLGEFLPLK